jgi:hypothetical protein
MIKRYLTLSLCLGGLVLAQQSQQTPPPGPGPRGGHGRGFGRGPGGLSNLNDPRAEQGLTQRLNLNAAQQNTTHTAIEEARVILKGSTQQERDLRTQLASAVKSGSEANIDRVSQDLANLHQQRTATESKALAKIYGSLSSDQKTVMDRELNRSLGVPGPGRRGPRHGGGAPPQGAQQ